MKQRTQVRGCVSNTTRLYNTALSAYSKLSLSMAVKGKCSHFALMNNSAVNLKEKYVSIWTSLNIYCGTL